MTVYLNNLKRAVEVLGPSGVMICIEPLNARQRSKYFLKSNEMAADILAETGSLTVKLLFDFYHTQVGRTIFKTSFCRSVLCFPSRSFSQIHEHTYE
eukprot:1182191-Prorocentrum_minimum.AAC.3